jgi:hypothetical protein
MPTDKSANPYKSFLMSLNELSISHPIGCPYQCWAVLTFLVRTFKVFSLVFRMRTSGFPQNLITLMITYLLVLSQVKISFLKTLKVIT